MRSSALFAKFCGVAACLAALPAVQAQDGPAAALPLWEIGALGFGVSQQAYPGADEQVNRGLVLPFLIYRGQFLRADRETAGLRAVKTRRMELDIGFAGAFGADSDEVEARRGMPDLGTLVEFGPRIKWQLGDGPAGGRWRLELPLRGVFDLSDRLAHRGMAFEPEIVYERRASGRWAYSASASAVIGDRRLADTLYGVAPVHARPDRPAYAAGSGLIAWRLGASFSYQPARDWRLFGFARIDTVEGAANRGSPLVRQNTGASVGVGVTYTWLRSQRAAFD
ncbi:MipA/OmpV family protein [Aquincola sp. MAHUQ-54]|uniref:MipA/OmpV family protein n=1 Tax=Aquincola agrisoli TaxID=3119538 RepID=A0AAW9QD92_9BURK